MAETTGSGSLGTLALGGAAAVAVIVGGVVLLRMGLFQDDLDGPSTRTTNGDGVVVITPSTGKTPEPPTPTADVAPAKADGAVPIGSETETPEDQTVEEKAPAVAANETTETPSADNANEEQSAATEVVQQNTPSVASDGPKSPLSEDPEVVKATEEASPPVTAETVAVEKDEDIAAAGTAESASETVSGGSPEVATAAESGTAVSEQDTPSAEPSESDDGQAIAVDATDQPEERQPTPVLEAPRLDLVRIDPAGDVVIAGRAQAGAAVAVLLDGETLAEPEVQNSGEFVAFASIPTSDQARVISLLATFEDQSAVSEEQFILAPAAPLAAVTTAETEVSSEAEVAVTMTDVETAQGTETDQITAAATEGDPADTAVSDAQASTAEEAEVAAVETEEPSVSPVPEVDTEQADVALASSVVAEETPNTPRVAQAETSDQPATQVVAALETGSPDPAASAEAVPAPQPEPVAVAVLKASKGTVEVVQPATSTVLNKVALDTISYNDAGEVQLAGRARERTVVRVYVNNASVASFDTGDDHRWGGLLTSVEPGVYTLRLDEVDRDSGKVLSRLETPFKRESAEVLQPSPASSEEAPAEAAPLVRAVTVQKGDTLWAISQDRYGSGFLYVRVFQANRDAIRDPDLIYPGQVFTIPE